MATPQPTQGVPPAEPELTRAIRLPHATAMVVGVIIGSAIFEQPSRITAHVPTVTGIFLVWLVCGALTLCGALVCAELSSMFPQSGGVYVFLAESFGKPLGFLWGWAMFWTMHSGAIAAIAMIFARYAGYFIPLDDTGTRVAAVVPILLLSGVNLLGVRHGSTLQALFTAGKLLGVALIIVLGFALGGVPDAALRSGAPAASAPAYSAHDFALALVAGLFAYGGWHMVTYSAGETVDPRRTIPRALALGTAVVTACYLAVNAAYLYVLPLHTVASSRRIAADAADVVLGTGGGAAMAVLVMVSTFGSLAGIILSGPRVYYAMARDRVTFRWLGEVHPTRRTPDRAIVLQAIWSCVLVATGSYRALFTRVIYTEWIFFGLMAVGLIRLRQRPGLERPYVAWGYPVVPVVFAAAAFGIAVHQIISEPEDSIMGLALVLVGLPVYFLWVRRTGQRDTAP